MHCNWGILGPGFIATRAILPAFQHISSARVLAVASRDAERVRKVATQFDIERTYDAYQALLDDPDIQVIYIALPNHLHREWTIRAAQAGKHVLCEKPLATSVTECDEMIAACQQANVLLMEAVMYRFHPRMIALKHMLSTGELGEIRFLHAAFSFPFNAPDNYRAKPEYGGGALLDVGSYCINAVRWLIESEPQSALSDISYSHEIDITTSAILRFANASSAGATTAHIQCSFAAAEHQIIEVVGSEGAVTAPMAFTAWRETSTELLIQHGSAFEHRNFAPADPYQPMVEHFTQCVLGKETLRYPATDGRETIRVLEMIRHTAL